MSESTTPDSPVEPTPEASNESVTHAAEPSIPSTAPAVTSLATPVPAAAAATGLATAALVLGIVAIVFAIIPILSFIAFIPAIIAVILGIVALVRAVPAKGRSLTGLILGAVAFFVAIGVSVSFVTGLAGSTHSSNEAAPGQVQSSEPSAKPAPVKTVDPQAAVKSWADRKYGTFTPVNASGVSDNLVKLPAGAKAGVVTATYKGSGNFSISVLDANNQPNGELLVNTIGSYAGTTGYGFITFSPGVTLQVSADAAWTITISPVSSVPMLPASGAGDGAFLYAGPVGALTATNNGSGNFVVEQETGAAFSDPLLVNEIGAYSGTVPIAAGPSVFLIESDGAWTTVTK